MINTQELFPTCVRVRYSVHACCACVCVCVCVCTCNCIRECRAVACQYPFNEVEHDLPRLYIRATFLNWATYILLPAYKTSNIHTHDATIQFPSMILSSKYMISEKLQPHVHMQFQYSMTVYSELIVCSWTEKCIIKIKECVTQPCSSSCIQFTFT